MVGLCTYRTDWFQCTFVSLVVVEERYRRRGIARELFRTIEAVSPTPRVFSSVEETNGPAIRMHTALGFAPSGHIDNLPQGTRSSCSTAASRPAGSRCARDGPVRPPSLAAPVARAGTGARCGGAGKAWRRS